ncbi:MAG TPA: hypothetical protein VNO21_19570 [Polyangiaceae bacterium]|nr:hypothetical protein [Polyangiaceae bacterium]
MAILSFRPRSVPRLNVVFAGATILAACASAPHHPEPSLTAAERAQLANDTAQLERRLAASPDDAGIRYSLCATYDQARKVPEALRCLETLDQRGWPVSIEPGDFDASHLRPEFQALLRRSDARALRVDRSRVAFVAPAEIVPENVAFDPKTGAFFLGSLSLRKVVRIVDGRIQDFTRGEVLPPLLSVVGMKVDPLRRTLWAATEREHGAEKGQSALVLFDVDTGEIVRRFAPDDGQPHLFNDVVVTAAEDVFVTDSVGGGIYRVSARGPLRAFVPPGTFTYPNGIALSSDEKKLFVAFDAGIAVVDTATGAHSELENASPHSIAGIDGLYVHHDGLLAVQNGIGRPRVVRFALDSKASRVTGGEVLESGNPYFHSPTTGVLVGNRFYYVANCEDRNLGPEGQAPIRPLHDVRILSLDLP